MLCSGLRRTHARTHGG
ncbi:trehalose-6-phosphate phosphatase3 [Zea mays]|uniref:Trehalose-6-phosphate phosphatase3 n=1 Tax=Zea mays TaxID=4577 RepID=A0A1D6F222_MAIZE|nr:trehalose-6-phosphate phosphatase3 [Zea mays]